MRCSRRTGDVAVGDQDGSSADTATALDRDDAMVLGMGEFRAQEQVVRRQVQVEPSEGRHVETAGLGGEVEHVSANAAILAQEVKVKARDRGAW